MTQSLNNYTQYYEPDKLWKKIEKSAAKIGKQALFQILSLYYLLTSGETPLRVRATIAAALGYFILPTDMVSDFIPVLGFTDDLAFLSYAYTKAQKYLTPDVKKKASALLEKWFPEQSTEAQNL